MVGFFSYSLSLRADFADDQVKKFLDRYSCSQEIEDQITETRFSKRDRKFYLKGDSVARIVNAIRFKRYIADYGLDRVGVAEKCWSKKFEEVVSIAVPNINTDRLVSLSEVQQLVKVAEETGFCDWHRLNVFRDVEGRHVFIDTEDSSFFKGRGVIFDVNYVLHVLKKDYIDTLNLDPEADEWFRKKMLEVKDSDKKVKNLAHCIKSGYDDLDIDFNLVKETADPFLVI